MAKALDADRLRAALAAVKEKDVEAAIQQLAPMVSRRRFTRPSGRLAEPLEIDEITGWLTSALDDPDPDVRTDAMYALVRVGSRSDRLRRT